MMPHNDNTTPKKKRKKFTRFLQQVFDPSNNKNNNNSRHGNIKEINNKKTWWQKLPLHHKTTTTKKQEEKQYMDWTTLSPNEPPLPFLIRTAAASGPSSSSSSELPPINKISTSLRELYTIVESSEINTTNNNSSNSGIMSSSQEDPQLIEEDSNNHLSSSPNVVYHHVPIYDWPVQDQSPEPIFNTQLKDNEQDCKIVFSQLLLEAYQQQQTKNQPTQMCILLNEQEDSISFALSDNLREDYYLEFKGPIQYIAPELFINPDYRSEQADIWILGISLYRMLVGRYPFHNNEEPLLSHKQILEKMLTFDYDIPKTLSKDARNLIQKLICPEQTRASFGLVMFHPWLRSYLPHQPLPKRQQQRPKKKLIRLIMKIILFIVKGPYPPPSSYHDLAQTRKQKQA